MKLYVIAKFEEATRARAFMDALITDGHEITFDWTPLYDIVCRGAFDGDNAKVATHDANGVARADTVVVLYHPKLLNGLVEFGGALIAGKVPIVVGAPFNDAGRCTDPCIFYSHPAVDHVETEDEARAHLRARDGVRDATPAPVESPTGRLVTNERPTAHVIKQAQDTLARLRHRDRIRPLPDEDYR